MKNRQAAEREQADDEGGDDVDAGRGVHMGKDQPDGPQRYDHIDGHQDEERHRAVRPHAPDQVAEGQGLGLGVRIVVDRRCGRKRGERSPAVGAEVGPRRQLLAAVRAKAGLGGHTGLATLGGHARSIGTALFLTVEAYARLEKSSGHGQCTEALASLEGKPLSLRWDFSKSIE